MQIIVTRLDAKRYATVVTRPDGVSLRVPGYAMMKALPHDIAHFAVESTLRLERGFWGSVAAGVKFRGMELLAGRQKPHADERSKATEKANAAHLGEAEILVGCFERIVDHNLDRSRPRAEAALREALTATQTTSQAFGWDHISAVCAAWRQLQSRWDALPVHDDLRLEWQPLKMGKRRR